MTHIEIDQKKFFDANAIKKSNQRIDKTKFFYTYANNEIMAGFKWLSNKKSCLDYGCGIGTTLDLYLEISGNYNKEIYGVDISSNCIDIMKKKYKDFNFYTIKDDKLHFLPDNSVESVYIINVLHHTSERSRIFEEINRVLSINGKLFIVDLTTNNPLIEIGRKLFCLMPLFFKNKFSEDLVIDGVIPEKYTVDINETHQLLEKLGFNIKKIEYGHLCLFLLQWIQNLSGVDFDKILSTKMLNFLYKTEKKALKKISIRKYSHLFSIYATKRVK